MRKPIKVMFNKYLKESKITTPVELKFSKINATARLKTRYNPKTGKIIKVLVQIDDKHFKRLAGVDIKKAKIHLQRSICHELGHLKRVEDAWEETRDNTRFGIKSKKEEDYAEKYAAKLSKISDKKYLKSFNELQEKCDIKFGRKKSETRKFTKEELEKYAKTFTKK